MTSQKRPSGPGPSSGRPSSNRRVTAGAQGVGSQGVGAQRGTRTRVHANIPASSGAIKLPIAVKYAIMTGVVLVAFLIYVGRSSNQLAVAEIQVQINRSGIGLAVSLAHAVYPYWAITEISHQQKLDGQDQLGSMLQTVLKEGSDQLLELMVVEGEGVFLATGSGGFDRVSMSTGSKIVSKEAEDAGVRISAGRFNGEAVRLYEKAIVYQGQPVGQMRVFLSASSIEKMEQALSNTLNLVVAIAILVALPIVALVGGVLTRPIRALKKDMALVAGGDLDHQSSISTGDELEALAMAFNQMTAHLKVAQDREVGRRAIERELAIASTIQNSLLPDRVPDLPGYELHTFYDSAKEVGGDYYDFVPLSDGRLAIIVADVSGKGVPGSLVMTMTRSLMRMACRECVDPLQVLARVNASLSKDMTRGMFVTLIMAVLDPDKGCIEVARAGHNPAYHYQLDCAEVAELQPGGIALGMVSGELFDKNLEALSIDFSAGDSLVLYTDGIIEAMDEEGAEYTSERFISVIKKVHKQSAEEMVDLVLADVLEHTQGAEASDDITLIVLKHLS